MPSDRVILPGPNWVCSHLVNETAHLSNLPRLATRPQSRTGLKRPCSLAARSLGVFPASEEPNALAILCPELQHRYRRPGPLQDQIRGADFGVFS